VHDVQAALPAPVEAVAPLQVGAPALPLLELLLHPMMTANTDDKATANSGLSFIDPSSSSEE
jgi:hypothetical protein